jgi:hypothetical protein
MFFQVHNAPASQMWRWSLIEGTPANPGGDLAVSPANYPDEATARQAIAKVRKSAGGVKFAKVVTA